MLDLFQSSELIHLDPDPKIAYCTQLIQEGAKDGLNISALYQHVIHYIGSASLEGPILINSRLGQPSNRPQEGENQLLLGYFIAKVKFNSNYEVLQETYLTRFSFFFFYYFILRIYSRRVKVSQVCTYQNGILYITISLGKSLKQGVVVGQTLKA